MSAVGHSRVIVWHVQRMFWLGGASLNNRLLQQNLPGTDIGKTLFAALDAADLFAKVVTRKTEEPVPCREAKLCSDQKRLAR